MNTEKQLYKDVPKELVNILNHIAFPVIPQSEQRQLLAELQTFVDDLERKGHLERRKDFSAKYGKFQVRQSVPVFAVEMLNSYTYPKLGLVSRQQLKGKIKKYLDERNIPVYDKEPAQ